MAILSQFIFFVFVSFVAQAAQIPLIGLLYNSKDDSLSTSNGVENHIKKGLLLAIEELKESSLDFKIEWIDVGETAESTLHIVPQLEKGNFDYIIGPSHSFQAEILSKIIQEKKLKTRLVTPVATSDDLLRFEHVILASNSNSIQANLIIREARIEKNQSLLVVKIKDCIYCSNLSNFITKKLSASKQEYTKIEIFESDLKNKSKYKLNDTFDHIFIPALEAQVADIISTIWNKNQKALYWSCDGVGTLGRYIVQLPFSDQLQISWLSHYHKDMPTERSKEFNKKYHEKYNLDPIDTSAFYYESLLFTVIHLIHKKPFQRFLTGPSQFIQHKIVRKMPVLFLNKGKVQFKGMVSL